MRDSGCKYNSFDWELMALDLASSHLYFLLEGHSFKAYVHQKTLAFAMSKVTGESHLIPATISEFTTDIKHVAGKPNSVADCLLCEPVCPAHPWLISQLWLPTSSVTWMSLPLDQYLAALVHHNRCDAERQSWPSL